MDKLTAAQRRIGMHLYASAAEREAAFEQMQLRAGFIAHDETAAAIASGRRMFSLDKYALEQMMHEQFPIERTTRLQLEVLELQRLLDVKDAEIDRLTQPTKPWLVVGWVIMVGCAMGVIGGIYKVIT